MDDSDTSSRAHGSLLNRLRDWDDRESWKSFFDTYWKLIFNVARSFELSEDDARDVVQETVIAIAEKMQSFKADPAFRSLKVWLCQVTHSKIMERVNKNNALKGLTESADSSSILAAPTKYLEQATSFDIEAIWEEEWRSNLRGQALERVKDRVTRETFQIYHLAETRGQESRVVADQLNVPLTRINRAKRQVKKLLREELDRLTEGHL